MSNTAGVFSEAECPVREPAGLQILQRLSRLVSQADSANERVHAKLHGVMLSVPPAAEKPMLIPCAEPYPPLFEEMREHISSIEKSLRDIFAALDRTEL